MSIYAAVNVDDEQSPVAQGPKLAIIIVTYNSANHLPGLLQSIPESSCGVPYRTIIVDNCSLDGTADLAEAWPQVEVIRSYQNLGYSGAINLGRTALVPDESVAILNPDLELRPGALSRLVLALSDLDVGIAVPRLMDEHGNTYRQLRREPTVLGALGDAMFGSHWSGRPRFLSESLRREQDYETARDVDWAGGAALVISHRCNDEVGPWDSARYFLYAEETDYARRARNMGYKIRFVPDAEATHVGGGSGQTPLLWALSSVNRIRYFGDHHGAWASGLYRLAIAMQHGFRIWHKGHRFAFGIVLRRSRWTELPSTPEPQSDIFKFLRPGSEL